MTKRRLADWLQRFAVLRWALLTAVKVFGPKQHVGAVGALFNDTGQVLLVEHVFRPNYNWGLPGGWVEKGENPADTVQREFAEELGLKVEVTKLLLCDVQGHEPGGTTPKGLALAYYCQLADGETELSSPSPAFEVLSTEWVDPEAIQWSLVPFQKKVIELGHRVFVQKSNPT